MIICATCCVSRSSNNGGLAGSLSTKTECFSYDDEKENAFK